MDDRREGSVVMRGTIGGLGRIVIAVVLGCAGCTTVLSIPDPDELVRAECQDDGQCEGLLVCCGDRNNGEFYQVTCQSHCNDVKMCSAPGPDSECSMMICPVAQEVQGVCKASTLLPSGYFVCDCP